MRKTKWFIYTVLIGLIPLFIRTIIFLFDKTATTEFWINEFDFIVLGLVLNLSNINELEDKEMKDVIWKSKCIGFSIISIVLLSAIFAIITYANFRMNPDINRITVKSCSFGLMFVSLIFSYSIYHRLTKIEE